jgi:hypothetical protein
MRGVVALALWAGCAASSSGTPDLAGCTPPTVPSVIDCGAAPLIDFMGSIVILTMPPATTSAVPTQPVTLTHAGCATPIVTSCTGSFEYRSTQGVPYFLEYQSGEITPSIRGEVDAMRPAISRVELFAKSVGPKLGFDAAAPLLVVRTQPTLPGTDPCSQVDGVSYQINGHPEIAPIYYDNTLAPVAGAATVAGGLAVFKSGLTDGTTVQLSGQKAGCRVVTYIGNETGNRPIRNGFLTMVTTYVAAP